MVKIEDINGDGVLQLAELSLNTDVIVLATPAARRDPESRGLCPLSETWR